jgi:hypothetical protein
MKRLLAIDPITRGFGFAVLDGPDLLVDWGLRGTKPGPETHETRSLRELDKLIALYRPDRLVVEDWRDARSRRGPRCQRLLERIIERGEKQDVPTSRVSVARLRRAFAPHRTKYQIALAVAQRFPELAARLPPVRKPWMSEKPQMGIFDAVALALAFYRPPTAQKGSSEAVTVSALKGGETAPSIMRRR